MLDVLFEATLKDEQEMVPDWFQRENGGREELERAFQQLVFVGSTPLAFSFEGGTNLDLKGQRSIPSRGSGERKDCNTVCLAVAADGKKLKPMMIFKGTENGHIARYELPRNPNKDDIVMICQPNAYQDEANMLIWIDLVLVPHLQQNAEGSPVVLFLDAFSAHQTDAVTDKLQNLGVQTKSIPGGCTWVVQPVDVGIGKPFKDKCKEYWWEWMIESADLEVGIEKATRLQQSNWVKKAWDDLSPNVVYNSWRKQGFSYFPGEEKRQL